MGKPTIVQGEGITLVIGECSHDNEQVTTGPTTDQINHWCPDCQRHWTTWPERGGQTPAGVAPAQAPGLTDEQIDAIAAAQDDEGWFTGRLTKLEWRAFARDVLKATAGVSPSDGGQKK
jgi:hypothetical protein